MTARTTGRVMMAAGVLALLGASSAWADYPVPSFFVDRPTTDLQDWTATVASLNGNINSDVNFQSTPTGFLNGSYYVNTPGHTDGVTLFASDRTINTIADGSGPDQMGQSGPVSPGEGTFGGGHYLLSDSPSSAGSSLLIQFAKPVEAVGLTTIDYFGSDKTLYNGLLTNTLTLTIYGVNGNILGSATGVRDNFQPDGLYFMGYVAPSDVIGSALFSRSSDRDGDVIGIAGIDFATGGGINAVPEPSALALFALGVAAIAARSPWRRRRAS